MALYALLDLLLVASPALVSGECHYNASGSVELPFPQPPNTSPSDPSGNFTISTQLRFPTDPGVNQSFTAVNASGYPVRSMDLPYEGCFIVINGGGSWPVAKQHVNEPNAQSCKATFSGACLDNFVSYASASANASSKQNMRASEACGFISPPKCAKKKVDEWFSTELFGPNTDEPTYSGNSTSPDCWDKTLTSISGFENGDKLSTYFHKLNSVTLVLVMAWNNASSNPDGKPWSYTRLFCMSTDEITPGTKSRALPSVRPGWGIVLGVVFVGLGVAVL